MHLHTPYIEKCCTWVPNGREFSISEQSYSRSLKRVSLRDSDFSWFLVGFYWASYLKYKKKKKKTFMEHWDSFNGTTAFFPPINNKLGAPKISCLAASNVAFQLIFLQLKLFFFQQSVQLPHHCAYGHISALLELTAQDFILFYVFKKFYFCPGETLWHLQKFLQNVKFIVPEIIPSLFSFINPFPIPGTVSTGNYLSIYIHVYIVFAPCSTVHAQDFIV
jgi:hypothetical protein